MKHTLKLIAALLIPPLAAIHAETSPIQITDRTVVFTHTSTDPKHPANTSGYNLGPSIAMLPDGRLMAAWFSAPAEGAESQRIMQAFSADQGRTCDCDAVGDAGGGAEQVSDVRLLGDTRDAAAGAGPAQA